MNVRYFFGDQNKLRSKILLDFHKKNFTNFTVYDGNIFSIRFPDQPVFVAHMDTVPVCDMSKPLYTSKSRLYRKDSGLGADDRAGVTLIMKHFKNINFILTRDEELGSLGAGTLAKNPLFLEDLNKVSCIIQLDCNGHKVVRGALHGYCNDDLMKDLRTVIPEIKDSVGSFSDIDKFIPFKAGINLSVGSFNQHTKAEYLDLNNFSYINSMIPLLNKKLTKNYSLPKPKVLRNNTYFKGYGTYSLYDDFDNDYVCDNCSEEVDKLNYLRSIGMFVCNDCLNNLEKEIKNAKKITARIFRNSNSTIIKSRKDLPFKNKTVESSASNTEHEPF